LCKGLIPGLARQLIYGSLRIGTYDYVRDALYVLLESGNNSAESSIGTKILAGLATGAVATSVAQPIDVIKIKMQSEPEIPGLNMMACLRVIVVNNGVFGL